MSFNSSDAEQLRKQIEESIKGLDKINEKFSNVKNNIFEGVSALDKIKDLEREINEEQKKYDESYAKYGKYLEDREKILKNIEQTEKKINKLQEESENIKERLLDAQTKLADKTRELDRETSILNALLSRGGELTEEQNKQLKEQQEKVDSIKEQQEEYFELVNSTTNELKKNSKNQKELTKELNEGKRQIGEANKLLEKGASLQKKRISYEEQLNKRRIEGTTAIDDQIEKWETRTKAFSNGIKKIKDGFKGIKDGLKNAFEPWMKAEHEAKAYAKSVGMSASTSQKFLTNTSKWAADNNIGLLFNKTTDELIKMQGKYSEVLGRNVSLTSEQKKDMLAIENIVGEDTMVDMANNLENFGMGMSDTADFIHKTMSEATKHGIAASKLTKTIRENIKMAQNYTFKNGLDGLTSMAKKAIELKTDMSLVNGFLEKTSTAKGALQTGAQLQVLGGSYAMGSDPLSMMYESLNDIEGLFDRAVGMTQGKVFYNESSGNFEMAAMDRYLMNQAATAMGIDPSKLIDVAFRKASLSKIEGAIDENTNEGVANDEDMRRLISNVATWNNGEAVVNINGKDKKVTELTKEDKTELEAMSKTDSQNLQDMAINLRSLTDIVSGYEKEVNNEQVKKTDSMGKTLRDLLANNAEILNSVARAGAMVKLIGGIVSIFGGATKIISGIFTSVVGIQNILSVNGGVGNGVSNMLGGKGKGITSKKIGSLRNVIGKKGLRYKVLKGASNVSKLGSKIGGSVTRIATSTIGKIGGGVLGGAISLGSDIATGQYSKDKTGSWVKAGATTVGAAIGSFIPIPVVGTMIGGFIGGMVGDAINNFRKSNSDKVKESIGKELQDIDRNLSSLFIGVNALVGNYSKDELNKIREAIKDKTLTSGELDKSLIEKLKSNEDFNKFQQAGVDVQVEMGKGGLLKGKSHISGGMPILGSNISVEGGEYVINKEATKKNLPLLSKINSGEYSINAKEPLGKQLTVHKVSYSDGSNMPHNSKIGIDPISINISGTIKLDTNGKTFDLLNLTPGSPFISQLTNIITKQINRLDYGSYNKGAFQQKFT